MKKLILVIAAFSFAAIVSAQSSASPAAATATKPASATAAASATPAAWYGCPKCDYTSQKDGKCPTHNLALVKDHSYYCPKEGTVSDKAGKCADGTAMIMMDCKAKMINMRKTANPPVTK